MARRFGGIDLQREAEQKRAIHEVKPVILIAGYFGYGNPGDEAILSVMLASLRRYVPGVKFQVVSLDPSRTSQRYDVEAIASSKFDEIVAAAEKCDMAIIGGGGLFHDYEGLDYARLLADSALGYSSVLSFGMVIHALKKPLALYSVGVGPFLSSESARATAAIFQQAEIATVRDNSSKTLLTGYSPEFKFLPVTSDPGYWIDLPEKRQSRLSSELWDGNHRRQLRIGAILRSWGTNDWLQSVVGGLEQFAQQRDASVVLIPFHRSDLLELDDLEVSSRVKSKLSPSTSAVLVEDVHRPEGLAAIIQECDIVLAMRLHGCGLGLRFGIPTIGLAYDCKIKGLMSDVGCPNDAIDIANLTAERLLSSLGDASESSTDRKGENALLATDWLSKDLPAELISERLNNNAIWSSKPLMTEFLDVVFGKHPEVERRYSRISKLSQIAGNGHRTHQDSKHQEDSSRMQTPIESDHVDELGRSSQRVSNDDVTDELFHAISKYPEATKCVLFSPLIKWSHMFQRPQQLARAFASNGYLVFYMQSELPLKGSSFLEIENKIFLTDAVLDALRCIPDPIIYIGSALARDFADHARSTFQEPYVVFDIIDDLSVSGADYGDFYSLLKRSDLVIASSKRLQKSAERDRAGVLYVPNAVDCARFSEVQRSLAKLPSPVWRTEVPPRDIVVGYLGAMAEWLDYELLNALAMYRGDLHFELIGVDYDRSLKRSGVLDLPNVHWSGHRAHDDLIIDYFHLDVGLIPFKLNDITLSASPIKLYEYYASGVPVVSTPLPECLEVEGVFLASDMESMSTAIDSAIRASNDPGFRELQAQFAESNTWDHRVKQIAAEADRSNSEGPTLPQRVMRTIEAYRAKLHAELESSVQKQLELASELSRLRAVVDNLEEEIDRYRRIGMQKAKESSSAQDELRRLRGTAGLRLLAVYWTCMNRLIPPGSRRKLIYRRLRATLGKNLRRSIGWHRRTQADWGGNAQSESNERSSARVAVLDRLSQFAASVAGRNIGSAVLILSPTPLSASEGQRSTHLALELANRGHAIVFAYWRWDERDWSGQEFQAERVIQLPLDMFLDDPGELLRPFAAVPDRMILMEFPYPGFFRLLASANAEGWVTVYDAVDNWEAFNRVGQAPWHERDFEAHVASTADLVTAVSPSLRARMGSLGSANVRLIPNGWPEGIEKKGREHLLERGEVTLGYFGYLSEAWFDWQLVQEVAVRKPSWRFHLIGHGGEWPLANSMPENISLLGKRPQDELAALAANWDVGIVPFKDGLVAADADPIKTYEYLAMELPVVATGVSPPLGGQAFVKIARGPEDFIEKVLLAIHESVELREERQAFATSSTWSARVDSLLATIRQQPAIELKRNLFTEVT